MARQPRYEDCVTYDETPEPEPKTEAPLCPAWIAQRRRLALTELTDAELDRYHTEGGKLWDAGNWHGLTMQTNATIERMGRQTRAFVAKIEEIYG